MAVAAHTCQLSQTGTAVAMTDEPMTINSSTVVEVTDATKSIFDPDTAITVVDNGSGVADTSFTVNYLFGTLTRTSGTWTGPVTITGAYLPRHNLVEVKAFEINCTRDLGDTTTMSSSTANHSRTAMLKDCSGSITTFDNLLTDLDSGGTTITQWADFAAGTRRVLVVVFPGGSRWRAFIKFKDIKEGIEVTDLLNTTIAWDAVSAIGTDQTEGSSFGFSGD